MSQSLDGRLALVTGASRGIGRATALALARAGAHVVALARTQGALEELDDEIRRLGGEATLVPCDLKDSEALDRLGAALHERWGSLDILVANAGVLGPITPLSHVEPKQWDDILAVNVTANWRLIRSLDALLRASDAGRVVFISSSAGHRTDLRPYWGPYAVTKAALDALGRTYAAETSTTSNVQVTVVNPGPLRTRMRPPPCRAKIPIRSRLRRIWHRSSWHSVLPTRPEPANSTISRPTDAELPGTGLIGSIGREAPAVTAQPADGVRQIAATMQSRDTAPVVLGQGPAQGFVGRRVPHCGTGIDRDRRDPPRLETVAASGDQEHDAVPLHRPGPERSEPLRGRQRQDQAQSFVVIQVLLNSLTSMVGLGVACGVGQSLEAYLDLHRELKKRHGALRS